jgi:hypothetical protein
MTNPIVATTLSLADETPLGVLPDVPYWVENYSWHVYDESVRAGVFAHVGRWWRDPSVWRQEVTVLLPDGLQLVSRAFARGSEQDGPPVGLLDKRVVSPGRSWRLLFDGPMQPTSFAAMRTGALMDSFPDAVQFDLTFEAASAVALFPSTPDETWGRFHYEQTGGMTGTIRYGGTEHVLRDAFAYRDHSRGPRDLAHHLGHNWIQARLPDGSGLAVYQVWQVENGVERLALDRAFFLRADQIVEAKVIESPHLTRSHDHVEAAFRVVLDTGAEAMTVDGELIDTIPASLRPPFDWIHGFAVDAELFSVSQPARLTIDGQALSGWCERSYRIPLSAA